MKARGDRRLVRLCLLSLIGILPLAYWSAWDDCFPLAKWLVLAAFGGAAVVLGSRVSGAFAWVPWWAAWVAVSAFGPGVTGLWRSLPEAALLVLPPAIAMAACPMSPRKLAAGIVVAGLMVSVWGIVQFAGLEPGSWLSPFHKGIASTVGNPDLLGGALLLPFALALAGWAREPGVWWRLAVVAPIGAGIAFTEARAAWLGALVAVVAVLWRSPGRVRAVALGAAAVALMVVLARPGAAGRLGSGGAFHERLWTWALSLDVLCDRPLAGWGASSFRTVFLARQTVAHDLGASFFHYTEYAHLEPLHFAVELGLIGLGLWIWGLAAALRAWRASPVRTTAPAVWAGTGAGALAVLADAVLSWPWHVPPTIVPVWIMVGSCIPAYAGPVRGKAVRRVLAVLLAVLLAPAFRLAYVSGALRLGQALAVQGRHIEAGTVYTKAFRLHPGDFRLCWYAATAARGRRDLGSAGEFIARGIALEPDFVELDLEAAAIAKAAADPARAEAMLRAALRIHPGHAQAWNNLGNLLGSQGRLAEAEAAQRRAVELAPAMKEAKTNLAITLLRLGKKAEARRVLEDGTLPPGEKP